MTLLADQLATHSHSEVLCTILLIATITMLIVGACEAFGLFNVSRSRFGALIAGVILLVVYVFVC